MLTSVFLALTLLAAPAKEPTYVVGERISHANLSIFPITIESPGADPSTQYLTLDDGVKQKLIEVQEIGVNTPTMHRERPRSGVNSRLNQSTGINSSYQSSQGSSGAEVNRLLIINHSKKTLVLLAGELVVGGKQDRIVQKDTLVQPSKEGVAVAVFCVEHGRWNNDTVHFKTAAGGYGGNVADPTVRGTAQAKNEQGAVWTSVSGQNNAFGSITSSDTYTASINSKKVQGQIAAYVKKLESALPKNTVGVIVGVGNNVVWIDHFPNSPSFFQIYWPKLLRSYAMDALSSSIQKQDKGYPTLDQAKTFFKDRSGKSTFEGVDKLFKLTRIESKSFVIYDIVDIGVKPEVHLHTCKMLKR